MFPERPGSYRYTRDERLPVEILVFEVDPEHVQEYLDVDHEVWTLGEAFHPEMDHIPFLSKEVWLNDERPGEVTLIFVFESMEAWQRIGAEPIQAQLQAEFERRFPHRQTLLRVVHEEQHFGIHRWSRFDRVDDGHPVSDLGDPEDAAPPVATRSSQV